MTWTPLEIPAAATPEEAFACGAVNSHDSQVILLVWVKGVGWCGARGVPAERMTVTGEPDTLLLRINDTLIVACDRPNLSNSTPNVITNA